MLTGERWRAGGDLRAAAIRILLWGCWVGAVSLAGWEIIFALVNHQIGVDAHAYWHAGKEAHPYLRRPGLYDAFLYSPVFWQLMELLALLPWPVFLGLWVSLEGLCFAWLLYPLALRWRIPAMLACTTAILTANIYGLMSVALVCSIRRPAALAFPLLTKIAPAHAGLAWHLSTRQWRRVTETVVFTCLVSMISLLCAPHAWGEWLAFLGKNAGAPGAQERLMRLGAGISVTLCACLRRKPWLLPVGYWLAMPMGSMPAESMPTIVAAVRLWPLSRRKFNLNDCSGDGRTLAEPHATGR